MKIIKDKDSPEVQKLELEELRDQVRKRGYPGFDFFCGHGISQIKNGVEICKICGRNIHDK